MAELSDYDWYERYDESHNNIRTIKTFEWTCKDGRKIPIGKMTDDHLLSAYKKCGDEDLLKEMVVRLFEAKLKEKNK
jgi:hypothetical protein